MAEKIQVSLSVASNCGDREANCRNALEWLSRCIEGTTSSSIYETTDKSGNGVPYMNAYICGRTDEAFDRLERRIKEYEKSCGRNEIARAKGEVPVDIDIVVWNGTVLRADDYNSEYLERGKNEVSEKMSGLTDSMRRPAASCVRSRMRGGIG